MTTSICRSTILLFAGFTFVFAQDQPASGGWRRVDEAPPVSDIAQRPTQADAFGQPIGESPAAGQTVVPPAGVPSQLVVPAGTFVNVRINQMLSSDRNQPGDGFSATLMQPLVVDGIVVAQRGQTVYGRVADVQKQRSSRPSQIALELTELTLVDGRQTPIITQLTGQQGGTMPTGQQVGTVAAAAGTGALIGAVADWGRGAAIGAGVGGTAGLLGVLFTRNRPTVVYPETALTFRLNTPLNVSTANAPMAFQNVNPEDYQRAADRPAVQRVYHARPAYGVYGPLYGPGFYPYSWGPGVSLVFGGGYWGPGFWGRGYWGRGWRRW